MRFTDQTEEILAEAGMNEYEVQAKWLKMQFAHAAEHGSVTQNEVYHILSLSSELYPEEMLDNLKSHGWGLL